MKLLRAAFAGFAAVAIVNLVCLMPLIAVMLKYGATFRPPPGDGYYVEIHLQHAWSTVCVSLLVFAAGFIWKYQRTQ